jgi:hypothetical protein
MYPAMARSFRTAGFQWATQFAYDPMATAHANTEYQTHYLNLAYTPSKAISLMIASKAFHKLPLHKTYGNYPADSLFDVFRVSYAASLSEMNSGEEFYYSNSTAARPANVNSLLHIAGVGSSAVVKYTGLGAYFLDKLEDGLWRLEVMPDAIHIRDPFERASPSKLVTRIEWQAQNMEVYLPGLGADFKIKAVNSGNNYSSLAIGNKFSISPGAYLVTSSSADLSGRVFPPSIGEFVAPESLDTSVYVSHTPLYEISANIPSTISAKIVGVNPGDRISAEFRNSSGKWKTVLLQPSSAYDYIAEVPGDMLTPGLLNYRIIIKKANNEFMVFPGAHKGDPYAWDAYTNETWSTFVASANSSIELFNAGVDRNSLEIFNPLWRNRNTIEYITTEKPGRLMLKATMNKEAKDQSFGWQQFIAGKLKARQSELSTFDRLVVRARTPDAGPSLLKVSLLNRDGISFSAYVNVTDNFQDIEVPLGSFKQDVTLLLPRPYPGFQPLVFQGGGVKNFILNDVEKLQVLMGKDTNGNKPLLTGLELESISLEKRNR